MLGYIIDLFRPVRYACRSKQRLNVYCLRLSTKDVNIEIRTCRFIFSFFLSLLSILIGPSNSYLHVLYQPLHLHLHVTNVGFSQIQPDLAANPAWIVLGLSLATLRSLGQPNLCVFIYIHCNSNVQVMKRK